MDFVLLRRRFLSPLSPKYREAMTSESERERVYNAFVSACLSYFIGVMDKIDLLLNFNIFSIVDVISLKILGDLELAFSSSLVGDFLHANDDFWSFLK